MRRGTLALWSIAATALVACGSRTSLKGGVLVEDDVGVGGNSLATGGSANTGGVANTGGSSTGGSPTTGGAPSTGGDFNVAGAGTGGTEAFPFAIGFGDSRSQWATAIEATESGAWVAGIFYGQITPGGPLKGPNDSDAFLRRYDLEGNIVKQLELGGALNQHAYDLALAPNGDIVIGGAFQESIDFGGASLQSGGSFDGFVARFDSEGTFKSAMGFGNASNQYVNDVEFEDDGSLLALSTYGTSDGSFLVGNTTVTSAGSGDFMLIRLNPQGAVVSVRTYGGVGEERGKALALGPDGTRWIVGTYSKAVDFGCGALPDTVATDVFVLGVDADGDCVASATLGSESATVGDVAGDIAVDSLGNVIVSGTFDGPLTLRRQTADTQMINGGKGFFVVGLSGGAGGVTPVLGPRYALVITRDVWAGAGSGATRAPSLDVDANDNVLVGGAFETALGGLQGSLIPSAGSLDAFALKMDANASLLWVKTFGDAERQVVYAVSAGPALDFVAGAYEGTLLGAPTELTNAHFNDVFVLGLEP